MSVESKNTIELGDRVRDSISGFHGIAYGRLEWVNKCTRISIAPEYTDNGKLIESIWFDEEQVVLVEKAIYKPSKQMDTGGPESVGMCRLADPVKVV